MLSVWHSRPPRPNVSPPNSRDLRRPARHKVPRVELLRTASDPRSSSSSGATRNAVLVIEDELRALLGPAAELARTLAGETPKYRPEYLRLVQLANTLGFTNAILGQVLSACTDDREVWSAFSVDAMARDILPMLRASVQGSAKVTLTEDSHSPLLHGNPLALKRALLHIVRSLAGTITVSHGLIEIGVALITFGDSTAAAEHFKLAAARRVVRLTIADNGIGMDPARIHALLQGGSDFRSQPQWEDAGLQIAFSIIKDHGGQLDIESHAGMGTMVRIDLPLAWPEGRSAISDLPP